MEGRIMFGNFSATHKDLLSAPDFANKLRMLSQRELAALSDNVLNSTASSASFTVTVQIPDVRNFGKSSNPNRLGDLQGEMSINNNSGSIRDGQFQLFTVDPKEPGRRFMRYEFDYAKEWRFEGVKNVHDDHAFDAWYFRSLSSTSPLV